MYKSILGSKSEFMLCYNLRAMEKFTEMQRLVNQYANIVVRLPNWVGDIVMVTPSLRNLKSTYPDKKFIATGKANCYDILRSNGIFDDYIIKPPRSTGISAYLNYIQKLNYYRNSASVLYTNSFSTAWDFFLARFPVRVGYRNEMRKLVLTHSLNRIKEPMDLYYERLTESFGAKIISRNLEIKLDDSSIKIFGIVEKKYKICPEEILIGLNPGAGFGDSKKWLKKYFVKLAEMILAQYPKVRFFVFGGPGDEDKADYISKEIGESAINLSRESLGLHNIKPFFDRMQLFITSDSGLRWYSVSMHKPTIVLFGSSDPEITQCHLDNFYPIRNKVHCSPCKNRVCPTDFACMIGLTPDKVFDMVQNLKSRSIW